MAPKTRSARASAPSKRKQAAQLPPPAPRAAATTVATTVTVAPVAPALHVHDDEAPRKKRRTLRDAEQELEARRLALHEAKKKLIVTVRYMLLLCL